MERKGGEEGEVREAIRGKSKLDPEGTHDATSYTSCNSGAQNVVKTLLVSRSSRSIWTHEFIRCEAGYFAELDKKNARSVWVLRVRALEVGVGANDITRFSVHTWPGGRTD